MDHFKILKKAFEITRFYRVLWIFGILLALTAGGGGNAPAWQVPVPRFPGWNQQYRTLPYFGLPRNLDRFFQNIFTNQLVSMLIILGIALMVVFFLLAAAGTVVRYVSETALIRMVDAYETSAEMPGFRQGVRLGWSKSAFFIFLIDLLIGIVTAAVFIVLFGGALVPLLVWLTDSARLQVIGTLATIGLEMVVVFLAILISIAFALLIHFVRRACILENLNVFTGIRGGVLLVWKRLGDAVIMGVILIAVNLGYAILMVPVVLVLLAFGVVAAGLPALLVGALVGLLSEGAVPWIAAVVVGLPIFLLVLLVPGIFLGGLMQTFKSTTWTLVYRELASPGEALIAGVETSQEV